MVSRVSDVSQAGYEMEIPVTSGDLDESAGGSRLVAGMIVSLITVGLIYTAYFLLY